MNCHLKGRGVDLLTVAKMMDYTPYIRRAIKERRKETYKLKAMSKRAWKVAEEAAKILKGEYSAKEVILFGSLLDQDSFHLRSDIDIAVLGIDPKRFFQALYRVAFLDDEIRVELVDKEDCREHILKAIEKEGLRL